VIIDLSGLKMERGDWLTSKWRKKERTKVHVAIDYYE